MIKKVPLVLFSGLLTLSVLTVSGYTGFSGNNNATHSLYRIADTVPKAEVIAVVTIAINATNTFDEQSVANLYTPNAVVADDEPPYSWNGPTAGIQWVNAVEKAVKDFHISKFKGKIEPVNVYQETEENVYVIVPVSYTGDLPGHARFTARGAFAFVLRKTDDKWLIKSQVWMPEKGMNN
ncbi:MAG TPA: hypothetical protein VHA56_02285 [Mucilaginibacter sp.]|nr:hypothetical protein [Mucilaginibacter sp.]